MVATWNIAAGAEYYAQEAPSHGAYYTGGGEPAGVWYARSGSFRLVDSALVDGDVFDRLYRGVDENDRSLVMGAGGKGRRPAFDMTFSAPRSVTLIWALASPELRAEIEAAQLRAVRAALRLMELEATFARRGHNGLRLEPVALSAALFQHGESRRAGHADGRVFADPNLHTHAVTLNLAVRADGTVGGLSSIAQRDFKMPAGSAFHAELSRGMQDLGFNVDRVGRNGIFEIAGVEDAVIDYFSARRHEIDAELAQHGVTSGEAAALASAIAKLTRAAKDEVAADREALWRDAATNLGIDVQTYAELLRQAGPVLDAEHGERLLVERLAELPAELTAQRSVFERKELLAAIGTVLVGTGIPAARIEIEAQRLVDIGAILVIGTDRLEHSRYTTPDILAAEQHLSEVSGRLVEDAAFALGEEIVSAACSKAGLSAEQTAGALAATEAAALTVMAGAPGSGKSTTLGVIVSAYVAAGHRVVGAASAWRVSNTLQDELRIESRSIASWRETMRNGHEFLRHGDVLVVDEAGLVDLRDMGAMLEAVQQASAKIILVGDTKQLQPIGGPALSVVLRSVEAARVETIVRQHEPWARDAIRDFGNGRAGRGLAAFADHDRLVEAQGAVAATRSIVDAWQEGRRSGHAPLLIARTNAEVMAISRAVRRILREEGELAGPEATFSAVTPSGQTVSLSIAQGDRIRFLVRHDRLDVVNGTVGTVVRFEHRARSDSSSGLEIDVEIRGRRARFSLDEIADTKGRARLGWGYSSTVYQSQGMTVDSAVVLIDHRYDRHQIYVAASRARNRTTLVFDSKAIDRRLASEMPVGQQQGYATFSPEVRRVWLAGRMSRASVKESALEVLGDAGQRTRDAPVLPQPLYTGMISRKHVKSREASLD